MTFRLPPRRTKIGAPALALLGLFAAAGLAEAQDAAAPAPAPAAPAATAPAPATPAAPAIDPKTVIATVDGQAITEGDLALAEQDLADELGRVQPDQRRKAILDVLIDLKLMAKAATAANLDQSDAFKARVELLRERALRNEFFRVEIDGKATDEAVKKRYDEEIGKVAPQEEIQASHILVETEAEANDIIKQLEGGADFATLAKEKSKDPGSAKMGGQLGYFAKGQMVPEFEAAAFALEPGKYTTTPVKTKFGYHVIKVTDKRQQPLPTLDQVKDQVRQMVLRDMYVSAIAQLRKDNQVEIVDPTLKDAAAPAPAK
ncbi:peptidylprolyl isomerase [Kaistia geumhonensis]|uniref:Parvulin-like PPIase n=1 Tax=Kaistia geumhonensis TaxID=410839 RepID=A0ABU0M920_9HYPH|nr:peptidylprolyl isomerase [Kaistia geumhonensis]MCX5477381.1 peptidylprolyl isomerase [Kaistia geumhonensis]MDQ0517412.1 peptidyl-prolyl cis-trans isomerase C [Kaistia geumhonensis]